MERVQHKSVAMLMIALLFAGLGITFGAVATDCETKYGGECHNVYVGCPRVFTHYSYSACGFLSQCCYNEQTTSGYVTSSPTSPPSSVNHETCGTRDYNENHRIVGGTVADPREYPWQVSLRYYRIHQCGGTLIDSQHVLTAAHCFEGTISRRWTVVVGTLDINKPSSSHVRSVSNVFAHSSFSNSTHLHDIAVVRLAKPLDLNGPHMKPACLPYKAESYEGRLCTVTGWGALYSEGKGMKYLREVDLPVISNSLCQYYLGRQAHITSRQLCAGFEEGGKDACQGDSGGSLVCKKDGVWKIAGVVSWGYGCALRRTPGVYTRVSEYLDWIHNAVNAA